MSVDLAQPPAQGHRANNFDVLRLIAASVVVLHHGYALTGQPGLFSQYGFDWGLLGVGTFFAISGFLVTASWRSQPNPVAFAGKRLLRIVPALAVSVIAVAFVLGPFVTSLSAGEYLRDSQTYAWAVHNVLFDPVYDLPGVFADHVFTAANGSLWSLAVEIRAYALVLVAGLLGLLAGWRLAALVALGAGFVALSVPSVWDSLDAGTRETLVAIVGAGRAGTTVMIAFVVGMLLQTQRSRLELRPLSGAIAGALFIASFWLEVEAQTVVQALLIPYLAIFLAFRTPPLPVFTRWGDASYMIYLISFPVEQTVISAMGADASPGIVIAIALPVSWALALLSWRFVENPALRLKTRLPRTGTRSKTPHGVEPAAGPS